jgi:isoleucyl-tRNA synthetase
MKDNQDKSAVIAGDGKSSDASTNSINSLPAQIDLPAMESAILKYWSQNNIFEKYKHYKSFIFL